MNIVKSKSFKNGTVYCLRLEDGMLVETTDTFLPYYTKDAIGRKQNFLDNDNLGFNPRIRKGCDSMFMKSFIDNTFNL